MVSGLLIAFLLLITLLAIPLTLRFHITWDQVLNTQLRLTWAFGLLRISLPTNQAQTSRTEEENTTLSRPRTHKPTSNKLSLFRALRQRPFRQRILRFISDFWRAFKKQDMKLHLRIGLGDPAETGQLWALVGPVSGILASTQDAEIAIEPAFIDQTFELDARGEIQVIPLQLFYLITVLILSPVLWKGIREARA